MMLVGIDASRPNERQKTGTEWYAYHIIQHLKKFDQSNRYVLYSIDPLRDGLEKLPPNFTSRPLPSVTDILWTQLRLSIEMALRPPDVLFVPAHTIPLVHPQATVLTVHDLGFEYFPELYKRVPIGPRNVLIRTSLEIAARLATLGRYGNSELDYHRWAMRFGVKHATRIITISEFTKRDTVQRFAADPSKITVIPHAYEPRLYYPAKGNERVSSKRLLKLRPYILFVGRVESKKNITVLLEAFRIARTKTELQHNLVLIGKPGYGYEDFLEQVKGFPMPVRRSVHFLGWVPEQETAEFYRHAELFVFLSNFEGFGIPVVQSMAAGVPVICSNTTSLPEVAGDAAMLIDPTNAQEAAHAIQTVLSNRSVQERLVAKGLRRARLYSWEKSTRKTLSVLTEAYHAVRQDSQQS